MEKTVIIEKFGGLLKEEPLSCVNNEMFLPNACLLEAVSPFLGYYSQIRGAVKPTYFYMMLDGNYSIEKINRATLKIKKFFNHPFDAAAGYVHIFDHYHRAIRIRNLEEYGHIGLLQKFYKEEGFAYHKKVKSFDNETAVISLSKLFYLEAVGDLLYIDRSQPHHGYFVLPGYLPWKEFKDLTAEVKFDINLLYFDAATAFIYENHGITDMVRVYKEHLTVENLAAIRDRYLHLLK